MICVFYIIPNRLAPMLFRIIVRVIMIMQRIMTVPGFILNLLLNSSLYLTNPPIEEGMLMLPFAMLC